MRLNRAEQVARHWADHGCPVVIHVDRARRAQGLSRTSSAPLDDLSNVAFSAALSLRMGHLVAGRGQPGRLDADAGEVSAGAARLPRLGLLPAAAAGARADPLPAGTADDQFHRIGHHRRTCPGPSAGWTPNASPCAFPSPGSGSAGCSTAMSALQRRLRHPPPSTRRHRAASGQPVVVPDPADPVGDPRRPRPRDLRPLFPARLDPGRKLLPDPGAALFEQYRKPLADAVEVRLPGQAAHLLRRPPATCCAGPTVSSPARSGRGPTGSIARSSPRAARS